ncbi:sulfurtransferase TusA family protein [Sanguibacter suaedae]|uniref:sulfurtransferase TusA family protein n=1 Tax=Sanguibacter suaedae TaxID=2795737 RepID=UPI0027DC9078|nr:sulfurtransferase TusA family protein [Sanguibacter suaedae]
MVDARGKRCPVPVIDLARACRGLPGGGLVTVLCTDPAAEHDVPAWARMRGHTLVGSSRIAGSEAHIALTVRLGPDA